MVTIGYDDDVFYDVCSVTQMSTISSCKRRFVGLFVTMFPHFPETLRKPINVPTLTVFRPDNQLLTKVVKGRLWPSDDDGGDCSCVFPVLHFNEGQLCARHILGGFVIYVNSHEQYHLNELSLL